ncbi:MAG: sulfotransferase [Actinobacteria bacterium]|nr:MAG: sulfotransferase [Actinomycetota bacterium]
MAQRAEADAPRPAPRQRPTVLYVMGAGRSGSTILGVALGNCENVFFAGELDRWLARSGVPRRCDPPLTRFWDVVRREMGGSAELAGAKTTYLERSSALLDLCKWPHRHRLRPRYRRASEDLYRAISRAAGVSHIVDSSHYPLRARELQALRGIDLYLLLLVRDPQGVVASLGRDDVPERRFGAPVANLYLWLTNLLSVFVFLRHPQDRRLLVRYEDFLANPEEVIRQILHRIDSSAPIPDLDSLYTGVPFHGNRLVRSAVVELKRSPVDPASRSRLTAVLQRPWAFVYSRLGPAVEPSDSAAASRVRRAPAPASRSCSHEGVAESSQPSSAPRSPRRPQG